MNIENTILSSKYFQIIQGLMYSSFAGFGVYNFISPKSTLENTFATIFVLLIALPVFFGMIEWIKPVKNNDDNELPEVELEVV